MPVITAKLWPPQMLQWSSVLCRTCARPNRVSVQVAPARGSSSDPGAFAQNLTKSVSGVASRRSPQRPSSYLGCGMVRHLSLSPRLNNTQVSNLDVYLRLCILLSNEGQGAALANRQAQWCSSVSPVRWPYPPPMIVRTVPPASSNRDCRRRRRGHRQAHCGSTRSSTTATG